MAKKNNVDLNDLSSWPIVMSFVFALVIAGGVLFLAKNFFIQDVTNEIDSVNGKIVKQEDDYKRDRQIVAVLPEVRKEVARLKEIQSELRKFLPTKVSMPSLINNVYQVGRNNGIIFDKLEPKEYDASNKYYLIKPVFLETEVGFESMSSFIEEVTTLRRIMNVESVRFQVKEGTSYRNPNSPLVMTATLRTYVFKEAEANTNKKSRGLK